MLCELEWDACKRMSINGSNYGVDLHVCWDWVGCSFLWLVRECHVSTCQRSLWCNELLILSCCTCMLVHGRNAGRWWWPSYYDEYFMLYNKSQQIWLITGLMIIYIHHLSTLIAGYTQRKEAWLALLCWRRRRRQSVLSSWVDGRLVSITPH